MKIFLDTADLNEIREASSTGLIDGVTTNPTLILRSGNTLYSTAKLLQLEHPTFESISTEVVADTSEEMVEQARQYLNIGDAVTIKVPCSVEGLKACKVLSDEGIKTNVTLVFSVSQAILAAKAGATYVSPFVGRLNDNSFSGVALVQSIAGTYHTQGVKTQILAASLRDVHHVGRCFAAGADVCTIPTKVFWKMYDHILTDSGLAQFQKDWDAATK